MGNAVKYLKTEFIALLFLHGTIPSSGYSANFWLQRYLDLDADSLLLWYWEIFIIFIFWEKILKAINFNIVLINPYNAQSRHEDETDMPNLHYVSRSTASIATATKENISLVKEVFNGRPLDYNVMSYVMIYEILNECDMKF